MRSIFFGLLFFCIWASFARWWYVCQIKGHCGEETKIEAPIRPKTLQVKYQNSIILKGYEQFLFEDKSIKAKLSPNNTEFIEKLAAYLKENPEKGLTITGLFRPSEKNIKAGFYVNLGTARADAFRSLLLSKGIAEDRISLDHIESTESNNRLIEPLLFAVFDQKGTPSEYEKLQYSFTNMTYADANFASDSDNFEPGEAFRFYADSVGTYLNANQEKILTIIGHTDADNTDEYNIALGMRRANAAANYFITKGIHQERLKVETKGEGQPIAPNDSDVNKQRNRRVNFVLE